MQVNFQIQKNQSIKCCVISFGFVTLLHITFSKQQGLSVHLLFCPALWTLVEGGCWQLVVLAVYTSTPSWPTFDLTYSISRQLLVATHHSQMQRCNLYFYSTFIGQSLLIKIKIGDMWYVNIFLDLCTSNITSASFSTGITFTRRIHMIALCS